MAGCISTFATYPFDLLRTRFAVQGENRIYSSIYGAIKEIYYKEGIRGFYRGVIPSIMQIMPQMGLIFESHRFFKQTFHKLEVNLSFANIHFSKKNSNHFLSNYLSKWDELLAGALAGIVSKTAVMPFDVVRYDASLYLTLIRVEKDYKYKVVPRYTYGFIGTCLQIAQHEGIFALYKGIWPSLLKAGPSSAVTFFVVNECRQAFDRINKSLDTSL